MNAPSETTSVPAVAADLEWVAAYWEDLADSRLPMGTPRPWRQPQLTVEQRDERDRLAWAERLERTPEALGASPAPVDVGILDIMADITATATALADQLAGALGENPPPPPSTAFGDPRPHLLYAARRLEAAEQAYPGTADYLAPATRRMVLQVAHTLSLVLDGQVLAVICPWCSGRTPEAPAGGERTWRITCLPGDQIAIVCHGVCEPPAREVGTWWRGRPCWPLPDWERLAKRVADAGEAGTHRSAA